MLICAPADKEGVEHEIEHHKQDQLRRQKEGDDPHWKEQLASESESAVRCISLSLSLSVCAPLLSPWSFPLLLLLLAFPIRYCPMEGGLSRFCIHLVNVSSTASSTYFYLCPPCPSIYLRRIKSHMYHCRGQAMYPLLTFPKGQSRPRRTRPARGGHCHVAEKDRGGGQDGQVEGWVVRRLGLGGS